MTEQIFESGYPRVDAILWITDNGRRTWKFSSWVTAFKYPHLKAGLNGTIAAGQGEIKFTIRDDWDPSKGYHVNATKGGERRAYCQAPINTASSSEEAAIQRYKTITNNADNFGEDFAIKHFMDTD